jgi:hypothetical protein
MRRLTILHIACRSLLRIGATASVLWISAIGRADDPKPDKPLQPSADSVIFNHDRAGATFIARPLKERYDAIQDRTAALRVEIREGKIDSAKARAQISALQGELKTLMASIEATKVYVAAATVASKQETTKIPFGADELVLIEAENVEIVGGAGSEIECVLEKTVLQKDGAAVDADFAAIGLVNREATGDEFFGYYKAMANATSPEQKAQWERFPFKAFVGAKCRYITITGLSGQEGNESISIDVGQGQGESMSMSQWRRNAKVTLRIPTCRAVGVRGGLGRFRVDGLKAPLAIQGEGNRDYSATYEVTNLDGSLTAEDIAIHTIDRVRGNVSVFATAYHENRSDGHGPDGELVRSNAPASSIYREIDGSLTAAFCRAELTIGRVLGRIDVSNPFGNTTWRLESPIAADQDHRIASESGAIELLLDEKALGDLKLSLFTECGRIHLAEGTPRFEHSMFTSAEGDVVRRSWDSLSYSKASERSGASTDPFERFRRPFDVMHGRPRKPGVDVISRAGVISVSNIVNAKE